jgi:hypothetical protein
MDKENFSAYKYIVKKATAYKYLENKDYEYGLPLLKELVEDYKNKEDIRNFVSCSLAYSKEFSKKNLLL